MEKQSLRIVVVVVAVLVVALILYQFTGRVIERPQGACSDSDGGVVYTVAGITEYANRDAVYKDYCAAARTLNEYYCTAENGLVESERVVCVDGCEEGACTTDNVERVK